MIGILSGATQVNQAFVDASWHELMPGEALDSGQLGVGGWGLVLLRPGELPARYQGQLDAPDNNAAELRAVLEAVRLAKVLRVAPSLNVRPNIQMPDAETVRALVAHRFLAMTDYQRNVLKPALREEAAAAGAKLRSLLPRRLRKGP